TSVLGGVLAVTVCAYLSAVYLVCDAERRREHELALAFRHRAVRAGIVAAALGTVGVAVLHDDAPALFHGLTHRALPLVAIAAVSALTSFVLLVRDRGRDARVAAAVAVTAVIWGWAAGQYPYLLERTMTIEEAAGARATLVAMAITLAVAAALVLPSLAYLLAFAQQRPPDADLSHD
ncbi:MAG: cytochrome bd ubiquinol oxidase subunit, partial [Actinomycetota bacterium]